MKNALISICLCVLALQAGFSQRKDQYMTYSTSDKYIYDLCFTSRGEVIGITDYNSVKVFYTEKNILINEFKNGHKGRILSIDISDDSTRLASAGMDSTIVVWDFIGNRILNSLHHHQCIVTSVDLSPDGRLLASGGSDGRVIVFDMERNEVVQTFSDHTRDITVVKFSRDGRILATAGGDKCIKIYEMPDGRLVNSLYGHSNWVRDMVFSADGVSLYSCGDDSRIIEWNISDIHSVRIINENKRGLNWLLCIDIPSDGPSYLFGSLIGKIVVWIPFGVYTLKTGKPVNRVLFKPNDYHLIKIAVATRGKGAFLVDANKMRFRVI
jgi:WD40 repeat protein